jgi:phage shock protein A
MGLIGRFINLTKGFLSLFVRDIEQANPEAVYDVVINERIGQHQKLMKAVSGIVYLRNKLENDYKSKKKELDEITAQIPIAVNSHEEQAALVLIERKNVLTSELSYVETELSTVKSQAEDAKLSLIAFQNEIEKLKYERETMIAKREHAKARIKIQEQLSGLSLDADIKALDGVRESIHKLEAQADVAKELEAGSVSKKLLQIRAQSHTAAAQAELQEMKKQLQLPERTGESNKTM